MSVISKITNEIGLGDSTTFDSLQDQYTLITEGVWEGACTLPKNLMILDNNPTNDPENLPNDQADGEGQGYVDFSLAAVQDDGHQFDVDDIFLAVERVKSNSEQDSETNEVTESYVTRFATQIPVTEKHRHLDPESIYYATDWSPVYWLERAGAGKISIHGAPATVASKFDDGQANYLTGAAFRTHRYNKVNIDSSTTEANAFKGIPEQAKNWIYKVCALKLVNAWLQKQAIEEEDTEMFNLMTQQKAVLGQEIEAKLELFKAKYK